LSDVSTPAAGPRERILGAAVDLFHRDGYNATSLRQISEIVGLQVGSLYNHIASKEALLFEIMHGVLVELLDETVVEMERAGDDPVGRTLAFLRTSIRFHALRQKETFIGNTELRGLSEDHRREIVELRDRYEGMLRSALQDCADQGHLVIGDVPLATRAGIALCTSVAVWYRAEGRMPLADLQTELPWLFGPLAQLPVAAEA
jgi:AcrR family transcriptional regulator